MNEPRKPIISTHVTPVVPEGLKPPPSPVSEQVAKRGAEFQLLVEYGQDLIRGGFLPDNADAQYLALLFLGFNPDAWLAEQTAQVAYLNQVHAATFPKE